jgi:hypothetical protein
VALVVGGAGGIGAAIGAAFCAEGATVVLADRDGETARDVAQEIGAAGGVALEVAEHGVLVDAVAPGPVHTAMVEGITEDRKRAKQAELPVGRFGVPAEVAPTAVLLASDPGGNLYVGQTLGPNSGDVMPTDIDGGGDPTSTVYREAGFTGGFAWGSRPAVLVVDFSRGFTDPECPLGSDLTAEVERTRRLLDQARRRGVLVVFTTIAYEPGSRAATTWLRKVPSLGALTVGSAWVEIDPPWADWTGSRW